MPDFDVFREAFGDLPTKSKPKAEWHPATKSPVTPVKKPKPDAIVLCIIHTKCLGCGSVSEYPSSHLLCRYGPRDGRLAYQWTAASVDQFPAGTKFEVIHHETTNANCIRCFAPFVAACLASAAGYREAEAGPAVREVLDGNGSPPLSERRDGDDAVRFGDDLFDPD